MVTSSRARSSRAASSRSPPARSAPPSADAVAAAAPIAARRRSRPAPGAAPPPDPTRLERARLELGGDLLALGLQPLPVLPRRHPIDVEGVQPPVRRGDRTRSLGGACPPLREDALLGRQALAARCVRALQLAQLAGAGEQRLLERRLAAAGDRAQRNDLLAARRHDRHRI